MKFIFDSPPSLYSSVLLEATLICTRERFELCELISFFSNDPNLYRKLIKS